jgi:hypothetical protein
METMSPSHCDLYFKGMIEVPACGPCGASDPCACTAPGLGCQNGGCAPHGGAVMATDGVMVAPGPGTPMPIEVHEGEVPAPAPPALPPQGAVPTPAAGPDPAASSIMRPRQSTAARPTNRTSPQNPSTPQLAAPNTTSTPGLIGPIGYDVQK